jgi:hypothetical protein
VPNRAAEYCLNIVVDRISERRSCALVAVLATSVLLSACGPTVTSFRENAETFILSENFLEQAAGRVTSRLTEATCTEPPTTEVGAVFGCSAADDAGVRYQIAVRITASNEMEFEVARA